jgi:hypothetical protein
MNSLWETVTTSISFFRSEASEETIMETVTTPLRFFRSEAPEETIRRPLTHLYAFLQARCRRRPQFERVRSRRNKIFQHL